jgi:lipopolysaccharide transport system permease protein
MLEHLKELWNYRMLLWLFVYRDIKARYKHTTLGITWVIIQPLFLMFVLTLVFSHFFNVATSGVPYPIFSYVALLPWIFISKIVSTTGNKFIINQSLITRIYFPREIIPLSEVVSGLIDFGFASIVFILMAFFYHVSFTPALLFLLIIIPIQIILSSGLALIVSVLSVLFRDLQFAIPLVTQLWMYASPVIYSVHNLQERYKVLFYINPLTGIIEGYRDILIYGNSPDFSYLLSSLGFSLLFLLFGYWFFKKLEYTLIDIM